MTIRPRNPLALVVLSQLCERPMHPYEIAAQMRQRGLHEVIKLNYGALYAVVESLLESGLIASQETTREGRRPERTVYEVTAAGREMFTGWLREIIRQPAREYPIFTAAIALMGGLPMPEALSLMRERALLLERSIGEAEASHAVWLQTVPRIFMVEAEFAIHMKKAELEWVRRIIDDIEHGRIDGIHLWSNHHATPNDTKLT